MSTTLSSDADYAGLLDRYDVFMFDCDGVLWQGDELIDGAVEVLALLRRRSMYLHRGPRFVTHREPDYSPP